MLLALRQLPACLDAQQCTCKLSEQKQGLRGTEHNTSSVLPALKELNLLLACGNCCPVATFLQRHVENQQHSRRSCHSLHTNAQHVGTGGTTARPAVKPLTACSPPTAKHLPRLTATRSTFWSSSQLLSPTSRARTRTVASLKSMSSAALRTSTTGTGAIRCMHWLTRLACWL